MTLKRAMGLLDQADALHGYRDMATLRTVDGTTRPADAPTDRAGASAAARERGMNGLADRLATA